MNRNTRTVVVVAIAVLVAALASFGVYRAIQQMPVREVEVRSLYQVVAAHDMPMGSRITKDHVKLVAWPASSPVEKGFTTIESVLNRGLIDVGGRQRAADRDEARAARGGRRPAAVDHRGHARGLGQGQRGRRRRRLRRPRHARRRDGDAAAARAKDSMTRVVVSDVQVLTAGTRYDQEKARDGQPIPTSVVTLLVTPSDAERIALAASEGEDHAHAAQPDGPEADRDDRHSHRGAARPGASPAAGREERSGRAASVVPPPAPAAAPAPKVYSVEAIRAAKRSEEVVR